MDEYNESYDETCPHCGHEPIRWRNCPHCVDGFADADDEEYLAQPEGVYMCNECKGVGTLHWCPNCGEDIEYSLFGEDEDEI